MQGEWEGHSQFGKAIHLIVQADVIRFLGISCGRRLTVPEDPTNQDALGRNGCRNIVTQVHVRNFSMGFL